jgi:hypothetical protein
MYAVDELDRVLEIFDLPQASVAEPAPIVFSSGDAVAMAYITQKSENQGSRSGYAVVAFSGVRAHWCGAPGDRALAAHPLYPLGLEHYSFCEIIGSSLVRALYRMCDEVPSQAGGAFNGSRHFIMTFKDSTFECVARGYRLVLADCGWADAMEKMRKCLGM